MEGVFYQSDVWLDGSYLGDTEGYFFPHSFDVTSAVNSRSEHVLAVEVGCERRAGSATTRSLLGAFGSSAGIAGPQPGRHLGPVRVDASGPVRISSLRAICAEAGAARAVLEFFAVLDSFAAASPRPCARGCSGGGAREPCALVEKRQPLAVGPNRVRWQIEVLEPAAVVAGGPGRAGPARRRRRSRAER